MFYARNAFKKQLILKKKDKNGNHAKAMAHPNTQKKKIAKHITKNVSTTHCSCSMQKRLEKTANIGKMRAF